jgi:hypothetical protein
MCSLKPIFATIQKAWLKVLKKALCNWLQIQDFGVPVKAETMTVSLNSIPVTKCLDSVTPLNF